MTNKIILKKEIKIMYCFLTEIFLIYWIIQADCKNYFAGRSRFPHLLSGQPYPVLPLAAGWAQGWR